MWTKGDQYNLANTIIICNSQNSTQYGLKSSRILRNLRDKNGRDIKMLVLLCLHCKVYFDCRWHLFPLQDEVKITTRNSSMSTVCLLHWQWDDVADKVEVTFKVGRITPEAAITFYNQW